jgi:hypothetical protein
MVPIADLTLQKGRKVMKKVSEKQLAKLRDACEHETSEDKQPGMMAYVQRWFNETPDLSFPKVHPAPPINRGAWQRRF